MSKKIIAISIIAIILTGNIFTFTVALAQDTGNYTLLAPLPNLPSVPNDETALQVYIPYIFNLLIGLSAVTAVVMIVFGGFQYMTSDAIQGKSNGKERIKNAIFGLVLVISAWLILYTINPNLLNLNLNIAPVNIESSGTGVVSGLQPTTIAARDALIAACPNCVTVTSTTGGTHNTGSAHYQGRAIDIASNTNLNQYLTGSTNNPAECREVTRSLGGTSARFLWEPAGSTCGGTVPSSGDHWHMSVPAGSSGSW
jgi:hypothetical protein